MLCLEAEHAVGDALAHRGIVGFFFFQRCFELIREALEPLARVGVQ